MHGTTEQWLLEWSKARWVPGTALPGGSRSVAAIQKADAVFEGGGVKGIALVGALAVAEEQGYRWVNVAGTSAGAIVAAGVAAGYRAVEIKAMMDALDFRALPDPGLLDRIPVLGPLLSLGIEQGIYEGRYLEAFLAEQLARRGVLTFAHLKDPDAQDERYRYRLQVIASDISRGRMLVLPQDARKYGIHPDSLSVARAVRMSMSIPFLFEPVRLRDAVTGVESYIVDGGLLSNYPVWIFDARGREPAWPTFGFRLVEGGAGPQAAPRRISGPLSFLAALCATAMEAHDARFIEDQDWVRTIAIPTLGVRATDFALSRADREALYQAGRKAAQRFFHRWNFPRYVEEYRREDVEHDRQRAQRQPAE
ncbi:MAG: patatin-like phospholipase family protein [Chloroflexi bacterium]|nr:patatin-like phospholipase family protein [Chloroflexota bacterium]